MPRLLTLCFALLFASPAFAQVSDDLADAYLDTAELPAQVSAVGDQIGQQIQFQAGQFPEPAQAPFLEIYTEALSADALRERVRSYVIAEGKADSVEAALPWYDQPLVAQMQALEDSSSSDSNAQVAVQMYAMTGSFTTTEITPEREAQMDRYLAITGDSESFIDLYLDIIVASQHSTAAISGEEPPPADTIRARMRPMLESNIGSAVRGSALYAYRDVTDEDFEAYLALVDTPEAQYANRLNRGAMSTALVGAITDAGEAFAQTLFDLDAAGEIDLDEMLDDGEEAEGEMEGEMDDNAEDGE